MFVVVYCSIRRNANCLFNMDFNRANYFLLVFVVLFLGLILEYIRSTQQEIEDLRTDMTEIYGGRRQLQTIYFAPTPSHRAITRQRRYVPRRQQLPQSTLEQIHNTNKFWKILLAKHQPTPMPYIPFMPSVSSIPAIRDVHGGGGSGVLQVKDRELGSFDHDHIYETKSKAESYGEDIDEDIKNIRGINVIRIGDHISSIGSKTLRIIHGLSNRETYDMDVLKDGSELIKDVKHFKEDVMNGISSVADMSVKDAIAFANKLIS